MSYGGMRSNDYFSKYDDRYNSRSSSFNRQSGGGMRFGGGDSSMSRFRDRGEMFGDAYSRTNSFGSGMGGFNDRRSAMQDYDMGYNDMRGGAEYNGRLPRSPLMRGMKRNMSSGSGYGGRSPGGAMGMGNDMSPTEALLSLGLQAKQLLETQAAAYGPPAPKMRRLNEGYGRPMGRGRGMARRGGTARPRGGSTPRIQKPRVVPAWRKTPFHCNFCHKATKTRKEHMEHVKSKEHTAALKEREKKLVERMYSLYKRAQANAEHTRMSGHIVRFCGICSLEYSGKLSIHKKSKEHLAMTFLRHVKCIDCDLTIPNRIQFERHNVTQFHIRNHMYKLMEGDELAESDEELECPEEYDETEIVGMQYVNDRKAFYCKVCDKLFENKEVKVFDHCKSKEHFDNFKVFVVTRKEELAEKAAEKAKKAEEEATAKEAGEENEEAAEGAEDEKVDDDDAIAGEDDEVEEVEDDEAAGEEDGNEDVEKDGDEDVEMEEDVEVKEEPAKSPPKTRTTPKRNAKAK